MKVRSIRVPDDIDKAIEYVSRMEKTEKTQSLRKLARLGFEYYVATSYDDGRLSLRAAAKLLQLSLSEAIDLFGQMGVRGNISARDVLQSLESINR
jgi:predicted HTH domain antitoxin